MDAVEFVEQIEAMEENNASLNAIASNCHGKETLNRMLGLSESQFKSKFRMSKSTFEKLTREVILFYFTFAFFY